MKRYLLVILLALVPLQAQAQQGYENHRSANNVAVTLDRLEAAVRAKGMRVFTRIDHAAGAREVGKTLRPTELLIFGNPKVGTLLMQSNQVAGIDLPMKALAWEDDGGQVWLTYNTAKYLASRHKIEDREAVVEKMTGALEKFTSYATQLEKTAP